MGVDLSDTLITPTTSRLDSIKIQSLSFDFSSGPLFDSLDFTFEAGKLYHLQGGNGAGKTTLLRLIASTLTPDTGSVFWQDDSGSRAIEEKIEHLLFLPHHPPIRQEMTPLENLAFLVGLKYQYPPQQLIDALNWAGLPDMYHRELSSHLSTGQKKRVSLARLYFGRYEDCWILDEPFNALDRLGVEEFEQAMINHAKAGGLVIFTSHQWFQMDYPVEVIQLEVPA